MLEALLFPAGMVVGATFAVFNLWLAYGDRIGTYRIGKTAEDRSGWEHDGCLYR